MEEKDMDGSPMNTCADEVDHIKVVFIKNMYNEEGNARQEMQNIKNNKLKD